jgi:hypothetical protein
MKTRGTAQEEEVKMGFYSYSVIETNDEGQTDPLARIQRRRGRRVTESQMSVDIDAVNFFSDNKHWVMGVDATVLDFDRGVLLCRFHL